MMAPFYLSVPVSQNAQHQDPETEAARSHSTVIYFIIYTFPTVTCQSIFSEKGLFIVCSL